MNSSPSHPSKSTQPSAEPNPDNVDTAPSETTPSAPARPAGLDNSKAKREGTHVLPMPDDSEKVAGKNRSDRVHTQPGDPGNIAPESQVSTNEKSESQD